MVELRRFLASLLAVTAVSVNILLSLASELKTDNFRSVSLSAGTTSQTTKSNSPTKVTSTDIIPKWLLWVMELAVIVALVMLFFLFKPEKTSERSERNSGSSETQPNS
ncbi:hypothetical protein [Myxosarcina sp. GI1(2024)]